MGVPEKGSRHFLKAFLCILAAAAALRLAAVYYVPDLVPEPSYGAPAQAVGNGLGLAQAALRAVAYGESHRTPSYPLFLALLVRLFGAHGPLLALGHHATGLATAACLMLLAREIAGDFAGVLAGLLFLADLNQPLFECAGFSESLMAPLTLGAVLACVRLARRGGFSAGAAAAAGALGAAAALCRPEFSLFGAVPFAFASAPRRSLFRARANGWAAAAVFFAVMGAWVLRNRWVEGAFTLSNNGPVTLLQRSYAFVDYDSAFQPEAKAALRAAQDPALAGEGDVPHIAERILRDRYGMDETAASNALGAVWREAVLRHPGAWLALTRENLLRLFVPQEGFPSQEFDGMLRARWPAALQERWERLGFFAAAQRAAAVSLPLERAVMWLSSAGMLAALWSGPGAFALASYLLLIASVAFSATSYQYYFELQPFQILFAAVFAGRAWALLKGARRA